MALQKTSKSTTLTIPTHCFSITACEVSWIKDLWKVVCWMLSSFKWPWLWDVSPSTLVPSQIFNLGLKYQSPGLMSHSLGFISSWPGHKIPLDFLLLLEVLLFNKYLWGMFVTYLYCLAQYMVPSVTKFRPLSVVLVTFYMFLHFFSYNCIQLFSI